MRNEKVWHAKGRKDRNQVVDAHDVFVRKSDDYHDQTVMGTVLDAVLEIICHDDYRLKIKNSSFEQFVLLYS